MMRIIIVIIIILIIIIITMLFQKILKLPPLEGSFGLSPLPLKILVSLKYQAESLKETFPVTLHEVGVDIFLNQSF